MAAETEIAQLVTAVKNGDSSVFGRLYVMTKKGVWFNCISILKNEENAKDIMQETYITAYQRIAELSDPSKFQSWANRIAVNRCRDYLKSKSYAEQSSSDDEALENISDEDLLPEEYAVNAEKRKIVMDIIKSTLTDAQYQTIILYYFNDMTASEIASLMDCPERTVITRISTAKKKIREGVLQYEEKSNDRLHAAMPVPFLKKLFEAHAEELDVPQISLKLPERNASSNNVSDSNTISNNNMPAQNASASVSAKAVNAGGKAMSGALKTKIIAGVLALVAVGGGITAVTLSMKNNDDDDDDDRRERRHSEETVDSEYDMDDIEDMLSKLEERREERDDEDEYEDDYSSEESEAETVIAPTDDKQGLERIVFETETDADLLSGDIKDIFVPSALDLGSYTVILDSKGDIYRCYFDYGRYEITKIAENTGITKFDQIYFKDQFNGFVLEVIDGNKCYYKVGNEDGTVVMSKDDNSVPLEFSTELLPGNEIRDLHISYANDLYIVDQYGEFYAGGYYYFGEKASTHIDDDYFMDTQRIWHNDQKSHTIAEVNPEGVEVVQFGGTLLLSDEGRIYFHDVGSTCAEDDPLSCTADMKFTAVYGVDTNYQYSVAVTEDEKMLFIYPDLDRIEYTFDKPEGEILEVHATTKRMIVKTTAGWFYVIYDDGEGFKPLDQLNNVSDQVVSVFAKKVVLSDGNAYDIIFGDEW